MKLKEKKIKITHDQDKPWKSQTSLCNIAHKLSSLYGKQMVTVFGVDVLCGIHSYQIKCFSKDQCCQLSCLKK